MAKALEVSVEMLITESIPLDIFLDSEIQPLIDEFRRDKNIWNSTSYDTDVYSLQLAKSYWSGISETRFRYSDNLKGKR